MKSANIDKFMQRISYNVWYDTYKWQDDSCYEDTCKRVVEFMLQDEKPEDVDTYRSKYFELLFSFKFLPGGRILSNAGTGLNGVTLVNCFVDGLYGHDPDSIIGIYEGLKRQAQILKSEGGYGFNVNVLRPKGAFVKGTGTESPGAVTMLNLWDTSSTVITSGVIKKKQQQLGKNKVRKGAQLACMSVWHPDIVEFVTAKQTPGVLTKFNLSVLVTDKFIECVKHNKPWQLIFPETSFEKYSTEWDGNIEKWISKGYPINVWHEFKDANELWELIIRSTYKRNEPGVIFIDRYNELNNLYYTGEYISSTNPCGEQGLPVGGACCLGHINLTQYINSDKTDFDYDKLAEDIPFMVRFLDSVNSLSQFPLEIHYEQARNKRRIGLGYTGYGSALVILKIPYGSTKCLELTEKLCKFVTNTAYQSSALLAKEKGPFPLFEAKKFLQSKFVKNALTEETCSMIRKYGLRNSHLTTVAPTGNTGILANNVSGGLEPVIDFSYVRNVIVGVAPLDLVLPESIDWAHQKYTVSNGWKWRLEGDQFVLYKTHTDGYVYKITQHSGLQREEIVYDYSMLVLGDSFDKDADYAKSINNLKVEDHIHVMKIFAKYVDSSISKTVNVPEDYPYEDFKNVYMTAYETGYIKGLTTFRFGTMSGVIQVTDDKSKHIAVQALERPKALPCHVHKVMIKGEQWVVFVGLHNNKPYEVFAGKVDLVDIPSTIKEGMIVKVGKGKYSFEYDGQVIVKDISKIFDCAAYESITRLLSTSLRYGVPITFIIDQLSKAKGDVTDFSKSILRALKKYVDSGAQSTLECPNCHTPLTYTEGCLTCRNCGTSKCS